MLGLRHVCWTQTYSATAGRWTHSLVLNKDMTLEVGRGITRDSYGRNGPQNGASPAEPIGTRLGYVMGVDPPYLRSQGTVCPMGGFPPGG